MLDLIIPIDTNEKSVKLSKFLELIISKKDTLLENDNQTIYEAFLFVNKILANTEYYDSNFDWSFLSANENEFAKFIITAWSTVLTRCLKFNFLNLKIEEENSDPKADLNERNISIFHYLNDITNLLTKNQYLNDDLIMFNSILLQEKLLGVLVEFLQVRFEPNDKINIELIKIASTIRNISKNAFNLDKKIWTKLDIENKLKNVSLINDSNYKSIVNGVFMRIRQKNVREFLEHYSQIKDYKKLIRSKTSYVDFYLLKKLLKKPIFNDFHIFIQLNSFELFYSMLVELCEIKNKLNYNDYVEQTEDPDLDSVSNQRKISIFDSLLFIINKLAFKSVHLALYLNKKSLIKLLYDFVQDEDFIKLSLISIKNTLFSNLTILVLYSDENKNDWYDLDSFQISLELLKKYTDNAYITRQINIILAYLANDNQIEMLKEIEDYTNVLLIHLNQIAKKMENNEPLKKIKCEYLTETKKMIKGLYSSYFNGMLTGTLNLLYRLAINKKEKEKVFLTQMESIRIILFKGNELEKYFALKLLAQLCFDQKISQEIAKDTQLINHLNSLITIYVNNLSENQINNKERLDEELLTVCRNIIWQTSLKETEINKDLDVNKHIMISYSWNFQPICIRIKKELEKLNYKTWMDVDQMHGSTIEAMAQSIESSFCVLICVCEKYRISENCQLEAKYANKLRKPIIPLIMQEGFDKVDGWLGFILSDKIFINFVSKRYTFEDCIQNLNKEIRKTCFKESPVFSNSLNEVNNSNVSKLKHSSVEKWNSNQLNSWMIENKIHTKIYESFVNLDGACLKQLYQLSLENPQFVYQTLILESNSELKLSDILLFITRTKQLFENEK